MAWVTGGIFGARQAANFDAAATTTFAAITNMTVNLEAGKTYHFYAWLPCTLDLVGGAKARFSGTATGTDIRIIYKMFDTAAAAIVSVNQTNALGAGGATAVTGGASAEIVAEGTITVNAAGTLLMQFGQQVAAGTSSALRGGVMIVTQMA